jgi:putative solute:sodium symporter small subunit
MTDFRHDPRKIAADQAFWRANLLLISVLLVLWAMISLGAGILFIQPLNQYNIGQIPLGFWMAQQGSILGFIIIVAIYALAIGPLERRHSQTVHAIHAEYGNEPRSASPVRTTEDQAQ